MDGQSDNVSGDGVSPTRVPTMRDVAAVAGVSLKTVSRVVNREPGVSAELAARVQEAVRLLDYRHNLTASSLRRSDQKTATIGLVLEDVANPFSSSLHRAIEDMALGRQTLVFAGSCDEDPEREGELLAAFLAHRVDGLIVVPVGDGQLGLATGRRLGRPIVFADRPSSAPGHDTVTVDNRGGSSTAVAHLAAHGHRRIAFLGDIRTVWTARERHAGYVEGMGACGLPTDPAHVLLDVHGIEAGERAVHVLLDRDEPPTALFTSQNLITIGAIRALQQRGAQHEVALIGFDDVLLADLLTPPVSVVAQDPAALGRRAAELLFSRLDGDRSPARHELLPTTLVARGSGEIPPRG